MILDGRFICAAYDTENGKPLYTAGGTYILNGSSYTEHMDFASDVIAAGLIGKDQQFTVKVEGDTFTQTGTLSNGKRLSEVWKRANRSMAERPGRYRNAIVPHIYVDGASDAIAFYNKAFGALELFRIARPNGRILHAELSIRGSVVMIGDPDNEQVYGDPRTLGRTSASLHIFVDNNQALLERAIGAGATPIQRPTDMFYGANSASVRDPFGHVWVLLSWKEDVDPGEIQRRGNALAGAT